MPTTPPIGEAEGGFETRPYDLDWRQGQQRAMKHRIDLREYSEMRGSTGTLVWQRGFYDHAIRGERELDRVRTYIMDNSRRWSEDTDNPANWRDRRRV